MGISQVPSGWVMSHTYEWVSPFGHHLLNTRLAPPLYHGPPPNSPESCHTNKWVMPHIWLSRDTHMNQACHANEWDMSRIWMSDMTHSNTPSPQWSSHVSPWDSAYSHVRHDSFICVTWLIHMRDMTRLYVYRDSFICVSWLIYLCDGTQESPLDPNNNLCSLTGK